MLYIARDRSKSGVKGRPLQLVCQPMEAFTNSYTTYERGGYKGRIGLSPPAAYPSTVACRHICRFPHIRTPRPHTKELLKSPADFHPTDGRARTRAGPKALQTFTPPSHHLYSYRTYE